jgi:hypothetical protein
MKKLLFILTTCAALMVLATAIPTSGHAQDKVVERIILKDTLTNTDTTVLDFKAVGSNVMSLGITAVANTGTMTSSLVIEGSVDGIGWILIDTMAVSSGWWKKKIDITRTTFYNYRCRGTTANTQHWYLDFTLLRRRDEIR